MSMYADQKCPECHADLQGDPIPPESRESYSGTHFSRVIGIYSRELDRTVAWRCPDCGHEEKRK